MLIYDFFFSSLLFNIFLFSTDAYFCTIATTCCCCSQNKMFIKIFGRFLIFPRTNHHGTKTSRLPPKLSFHGIGKILWAIHVPWRTYAIFNFLHSGIKLQQKIIRNPVNCVNINFQEIRIHYYKPNSSVDQKPPYLLQLFSKPIWGTKDLDTLLIGPKLRPSIKFLMRTCIALWVFS